MFAFLVDGEREGWGYIRIEKFFDFGCVYWTGFHHQTHAVVNNCRECDTFKVSTFELIFSITRKRGNSSGTPSGDSRESLMQLLRCNSSYRPGIRDELHSSIVSHVPYNRPFWFQYCWALSIRREERRLCRARVSILVLQVGLFPRPGFVSAIFQNEMRCAFHWGAACLGSASLTTCTMRTEHYSLYPTLQFVEAPRNP